LVPYPTSPYRPTSSVRFKILGFRTRPIYHELFAQACQLGNPSLGDAIHEMHSVNANPLINRKRSENAVLDQLIGV
ncbi:MAG TPA: hypothetical protein VK979_08115, partial [Guyparkeria sp.]|nr:hypothetical protein [Guyparkeria sp.]